MTGSPWLGGKEFVTVLSHRINCSDGQKVSGKITEEAAVGAFSQNK
jgi:hypothetical protein